MRFGIATPLTTPALTLVRSSDQAIIATSDNWTSDPAASQIQDTGFAPSMASEAAIVMTLPPGAYSALVSGGDGGTGVDVVAVYEVDHPENPLVNLSTRGHVQVGGDVLIGGVVIGGTGPQQVAVVATGPSLSALGVPGAMTDPKITLVRVSDGAVVASNDNWRTDTNAAQLQAKGFAPSDDREAALLVTLPPGAYTAVVSEASGKGGTAVIGVYNAP
jgi:hypothetical protein